MHISKPQLTMKRIVIILTALLLIGAIYFTFIRMQPSDCTSVEKYDSLTGQCYYECNDDKDCADKAAKIDAELNAFFDGSQTKISQKEHTQEKPKQPTSTYTEVISKDFTGSETDGSVYTVQQDYSLKPTPSTEDKNLWDLFVRVAGKEDIGKYVQSFEVFKDDNNDTAASVWQSQTPGKWHVNVNAAFANDKKDLVHTMVHEYGHILSLNSTQVTGVQGACPRLSLSEGCSNEQSYINAFHSSFWKKYGDDIPSNDGENQDEVQDFYNKNPSAFVSDYSATNITEDFAESWAIFVTTGKPNGGDEKDKKVRFFYDNATLSARRNEIRINIAKDIQ
jgi:hypothetical protein